MKKKTGGCKLMLLLLVMNLFFAFMPHNSVRWLSCLAVLAAVWNLWNPYYGSWFELKEEK